MIDDSRWDANDGALATEPLGVGVLGRLQDGAGRSRLDDPAAVHHDEVIGTLGREAEVVRDQHDRDTEVVGQLVEVVEDLLLHRHVESRGRLVGDQELGTSRETHRDQGALAHTAGELVGVLTRTTLGVRQASLLEQLDDALVSGGTGGDAVGDQGFLDLRADPPERVEVGHRVLRHQADRRATQREDLTLACLADVLALEPDRAAGHLAGAGQQPDHSVRERRLARSGLTHDRDGLTRVDRQVGLVDRRQDLLAGAESDAEVLHLQERCDVVHFFLAFGSRASRTASPSRMKPSTVSASAAAGTYMTLRCCPERTCS